MTNRIVPTSVDPTYVQRTQLDGIEYLLWFRFSAREGRWYADITDQDQVQIASGVKIVAGFLLARGAILKPPGDLICVDMQSSDADLKDAVDPGLLQLGDRHLLFYFDAITQ